MKLQAAVLSTLLLASLASAGGWSETTNGRGALLLLTGLQRDSEDPDRQGVGISFDFDAYPTDILGLRVGVGYFQLESREPANPFSESRIQDTNAVFLNIGPILRHQGRLFSPYISGGPGFYLSNYEGSFGFQVGGGASASTAGRGVLSLGLQGGAGLDVHLSGLLGLSAEVRYTQILTEGRNLDLLGLHLGLETRFR